MRSNLPAVFDDVVRVEIELWNAVERRLRREHVADGGDRGWGNAKYVGVCPQPLHGDSDAGAHIRDLLQELSVERSRLEPVGPNIDHDETTLDEVAGEVAVR